MHKLARLDHQFIWHPFTQMREWAGREPIIVASGKGAVLRDVKGKEYLDANASIWTNLHGHGHPKLNAAIRRQLEKIAHSSALGLANEPASLLAEQLVMAANWESAESGVRSPETRAAAGALTPHAGPRNPHLKKVFYSDDGSTAMEVALKLAYEFARRTGRSKCPRFLSLNGAYHGDTIGAASLGHLNIFKSAYSGLLFETDNVMAPYCYRCPYNRAKPDRADARHYRKCRWECVDEVERKFSKQRKKGNPYAAMIVEPLMQGAAGMIPQPPGWLCRVAQIVRGNGAQLIADEVMTGFGRTGVGLSASSHASPAGAPNQFLSAIASPPLFACHHEGVQPDFLALAKGMTAGYLPMAATLTTQTVFDAFLGDYSEFKTFFHGHSFTGNQLGSSVALASLELLHSRASIRARAGLEKTLKENLQSLWSAPNVGDVRQVGLVAGIELVRNWRTREPFDIRERAGLRVCEAMALRGVLTRPIGNVIVLMPPYCTQPKQARQMIAALSEGIQEVFSLRC
jgi:adenosylmethionine-8-amino-7-oxononanoate aminotransferase